jgi:hypothetical protein
MNYLDQTETKIKDFLSHQETINFYSIVFSLVTVILTLLIYALNYQSLPPQIPLFYSLAWGDNQLVSLSQFIILPSVMILIILLNLIFTWHLHSSQSVLKKIISISTLLTSILLFLAAFKIIYTFI